MRVRILTRASDLARLQGHLVQRRLDAAGVDADLIAREASGDRDTATPLWQLGNKGVFTADLSDALARGDADLVVHSWKDLPIEPRGDTIVAATLPREDPRDVLLIREDAAAKRAPRLSILSSSPRRALMLGGLLPGLLPWPVDAITFAAVRGNVPTRLRQLAGGAADGLVVAKAALDRLLDPASPFAEAADAVREAMRGCRWMVLPLREQPCAAGQGALALEIAVNNTALRDVLKTINHAPTWQAVQREREILAGYGGGCAQAIGVTVLPLPFGTVTSLRGRTDAGETLEQWSLESTGPVLPKAPLAAVWPRPDELHGATRRPLSVPDPSGDRGLYVTRNEALPASWDVQACRIVWAAGSSTWRKLAARGVWVHGSSEGLGTFEPSAVDRLAGRAMTWHRLTHTRADVADAVPTYEADTPLASDLAARTHFFWRSGSEYRLALAAAPSIRDGWHACGPGHTFDVVQRLSGARRVRPYLTYDAWLEDIRE